MADDLLRLAPGENLDAAKLASPINVVQELDEPPDDADVAQACAGAYELPIGELVVSSEGDSYLCKGLEIQKKPSCCEILT